MGGGPIFFLFPNSQDLAGKPVKILDPRPDPPECIFFFNFCEKMPILRVKNGKFRDFRDFLLFSAEKHPGMSGGPIFCFFPNSPHLGGKPVKILDPRPDPPEYVFFQFRRKKVNFDGKKEQISRFFAIFHIFSRKTHRNGWGTKKKIYPNSPHLGGKPVKILDPQSDPPRMHFFSISAKNTPILRLKKCKFRDFSLNPLVFTR